MKKPRHSWLGLSYSALIISSAGWNCPDNTWYWHREDVKMDTVSAERRSEIMARVVAKNTRPELAVRRLLHGLGCRFRLHGRDLPGRPDVVLPKWRTVVLIHGCFWHRHEGCPNTRTPKSRTDFWTTKFDENVRRDQLAREKLESLGWRVVVIWECELKDIPTLTERVANLIRAL
jgi:DNA mismatch endonuclease (patch repair protein)